MTDLDPTIADAIRAQAAGFGLPAELVTAIVRVESGGNSAAQRTEPGYRYVWDCKRRQPFRELLRTEILSAKAPAGFPSGTPGMSVDTEWMGQRTSHGPMQIMGAVAREYGFTGWFAELYGPLGIRYGCLHLSRLCRRFFTRHGWGGVVEAYNAGSPGSDAGKAYLAKVIRAGFDPNPGKRS
jgi:soluble lytic murein transglycosylase-like protein